MAEAISKEELLELGTVPAIAEKLFSNFPEDTRITFARRVLRDNGLRYNSKTGEIFIPTPPAYLVTPKRTTVVCKSRGAMATFGKRTVTRTVKGKDIEVEMVAINTSRFGADRQQIAVWLPADIAKKVGRWLAGLKHKLPEQEARAYTPPTEEAVEEVAEEVVEEVEEEGLMSEANIKQVMTNLKMSREEAIALIKQQQEGES